MSDPQLIAGDCLPTRTEADSVHQQTLLGVEPQELRAGEIYAIRTAVGVIPLRPRIGTAIPADRSGNDEATA